MGSIALLIPVVVYMYYVTIESWCLFYAGYYLFGAFEGFGKNPYAYGEFFKTATGVKNDGAVLEGGLQPIVWFFLATFLINFIVIYRGLSSGIEAFCKWAMPVLIIAAVVVVARVLTLPEQPIPPPWQRSLPEALPAESWQVLRSRLIDPSTDGKLARVWVENEFAHYYQGIVSGAEGFRDVPLAPPAGFLQTEAGFATALAELRDPLQGERYRKWLEQVDRSMTIEQKRDLQRLERQQMRIDQAASQTVAAAGLPVAGFIGNAPSRYPGRKAAARDRSGASLYSFSCPHRTDAVARSRNGKAVDPTVRSISCPKTKRRCGGG